MVLMPIIALTADALPERRRFYDSIGLTGFLTKPINTKQLASALSGITGQQERQNALRETTAINSDRLAELRSVLDDGTIASLVDLIVREASTRPGAIRALLMDGDLPGASRIAHALYGAASNIGAMRLAESSRTIEIAADLETALSALTDLETAASAVITSALPTPSTISKQSVADAC